MNLVDLTHRFHPSISVYPGSPSPEFKQLANVVSDGYAEKQILFRSHHGTHIDATAHMLENGQYLDDLDLSRFMGKAVCIDVASFANKKIPVEFFLPFSELLSSVDFVLLHTGWSQKWMQAEYQNNYPTMHAEATVFLCQHKLKGIGMDCLSPDPVDSVDYSNHHIAFSKHVLLIENLTNLKSVPFGKLIQFQCYPMKIKQADGAPVRAIAWYD